eukprot:g4115.t1
MSDIKREVSIHEKLRTKAAQWKKEKDSKTKINGGREGQAGVRMLQPHVLLEPKSKRVVEKRLNSLWLSFDDSYDGKALEAQYIESEARLVVDRLTSFGALCGVIYVAFLYEALYKELITYSNEASIFGAKAWTYPVVLTLVCLIIGEVLLVFKREWLLKNDRLQTISAVIGLVTAIMHIIRAVLNPYNVVGYISSIMFVHPFYLGVFSTQIGLRFPCFLLVSLIFTLCHFIGIYAVRSVYMNSDTHTDTFRLRNNMTGVLLDEMGDKLWVYDLCSLAVFLFVSRRQDMEHRLAFLRQLGLDSAKVDVHVTLEKKGGFLKGWFQKVTTRSVLKSLGTTDWVIDFSSIDKKIMKKIGSGQCGQIFSTTYNGHPVALKQLYTQLMDETDIEDFKNECAVLSRLHCPQIIHFYGVTMDREALYIVFELLSLTLATLIWKRVDVVITPESYLFIARNVAQGLMYLHGRGFAHRDVKPQNILLDASMTRPYLCDFGLSVECEEIGASATFCSEMLVNIPTSESQQEQLENQYRTTSIRTTTGGSSRHDVGTPPFMAPELFGETLPAGYDARCSDVYAFDVFDMLKADGNRLFESSQSRWKRMQRSVNMLNLDMEEPNANSNGPRRMLHRRTLSSIKKGEEDFEEDLLEEEDIVIEKKKE